jgi:GR25 family glycosyltransferase involved in LPS biosynthesis
MSIPILIISMPHRHDRREAISANLKSFGHTEFNFVRAVDGSLLNYPYPRKGAGIRGCHESHLALWKALVKRKCDAIIMEDDCYLTESLEPTLEKIKGRKEPIHFFGWSGYSTFEYEITNIEGIVKPKFPLATHCYLARWQFLRPLIGQAEKRDKVIDCITAEAGGTANYPMIAFQAKGFSDVVGTLVDYSSVIK